jgi:RNA polymerase-associated protein LEO1
MCKQETNKSQSRRLDDEELDSGDDLDRTDRLDDEPEEEYVTQEKVTMDLELPRQPIPEPSDGEVCITRCITDAMHQLTNEQ